MQIGLLDPQSLPVTGVEQACADSLKCAGGKNGGLPMPRYIVWSTDNAERINQAALIATAMCPTATPTEPIIAR